VGGCSNGVDIKLMLLHETRNDDGIRAFFNDVWECYVKALMNPFYSVDKTINSPVFESKVRAIAKVFSLILYLIAAIPVALYYYLLERYGKAIGDRIKMEVGGSSFGGPCSSWHSKDPNLYGLPVIAIAEKDSKRCSKDPSNPVLIRHCHFLHQSIIRGICDIEHDK